MAHRNVRVATNAEHLRERVVRLVREGSHTRTNFNQPDLFHQTQKSPTRHSVTTPMTSVWEFLGYVCDVLPTRNLYLFGGVLRDLALYGRANFRSDIDLVVDDDWLHLVSYLVSRGAIRNRFGGLRLKVDGQPIDIWNARETWAIRKGFVSYDGIESLTKTTILNWDAILLNWHSKHIICDQNYFRQLRNRVLDVILQENPNPLGATVKAFRHFCLDDARILTISAARYLSHGAHRYSLQEIVSAEMNSYGNSVVDAAVLRFFRQLDFSSISAVRRQFDGASRISQPLLI